MQPGKTIGFVFIEKFADWEFGLLSASAVEWFGARTLALTPRGMPVVSIGGFRLAGERGQSAAENADLDAVAVIGSENWFGESPPDVTDLLASVKSRGGVVGGICAGTLALARAGLFEGRRHTSNGRQWILEKEPGYRGAEFYQDSPRAVAHGNIISAPGSAPSTFAAAFLEALYPDQTETLAEMRKVFSSEYRGLS